MLDTSPAVVRIILAADTRTKGEGMTREKTRELLPVMQGFADGKQIQFFDEGEWKDVDLPGWMSETQYRIKPELRSYWIVNTTTSGYHAFSDESAAYSFAANARIKPEIIHVREVL